MVPACIPSTWESEIRRSQALGSLDKASLNDMVRRSLENTKDLSYNSMTQHLQNMHKILVLILQKHKERKRGRDGGMKEPREGRGVKLFVYITQAFEHMSF